MIPPDLDLPPLPESFGWRDLNQGKAENKNWTNEEKLSNQKNINELRLLWVTGWVIPVVLFFFVVLYVFAIGFWAFHYLAPECWHWITDANILDKIESVVFSGALGAIVSAKLGQYFQSGRISNQQ